MLPPENTANCEPEKIAATQGRATMTRSDRGERYLNTPDALLADMDFPDAFSFRLIPVVLVFILFFSLFFANGNPDRVVSKILLFVIYNILTSCVILATPSLLSHVPLPSRLQKHALALVLPVFFILLGGWFILSVKLMDLYTRQPQSAWLEQVVFMVCIGFGAAVAAGVLAPWLPWFLRKLRGGEKRIALKKIRRFVQMHPEWNLRVYRTASGLRILATHRPFAPADPQSIQCREYLGITPASLEAQSCFRVRVSAKPWNIGMSCWDVSKKSTAWIENYEAAAAKFAACQLIEQCGSGKEHPDIAPVRAWHDRLCRATEALPLA